MALSHGLNLEPESMVNLAFVKNDSYEKGPDSVVVHVYVKEICRDTSRVLFREQDFTLIFQTRCVAEAGRGAQCASDGQVRQVFSFVLPSLCPAPPLQGWKLSEAASGLWAPHHLPLAGEAQVSVVPSPVSAGLTWVSISLACSASPASPEISELGFSLTGT